VKVKREDTSAGLNANIRIKKVMGDVGTFMLGRFRAGFTSAPHHHTYEQINIGLTGMYTLLVAGSRHTVSAMRGVVIPPDVEHNNDVPEDAGDPELIEFQSTRRLDFPPERQQVTLPVGPTALPVPEGRQIAFDFGASSPGWQTIGTGVRMKASTGGTTAISSWEFLPTAQDSVDLRRLLPDAERFVYVVEGAVEAGTDARRLVMNPGALLVERLRRIAPSGQQAGRPASAAARVRGASLTGGRPWNAQDDIGDRAIELAKHKGCRRPSRRTV